MMLVREWMTKDAITVGPQTSIFRAWDLMKDRRIRHLPVMEDGRLVGIVTDRDLRLVLPSPATTLGAYELNYLLDKMTVSEVMTKDVITTTPSASITNAARVLLRNRIGALPVFAGPILVGILTRADALEALSSANAAGAMARVA
jgi:acetoin utilization protein AcuB